MTCLIGIYRKIANLYSVLDDSVNNTHTSRIRTIVVLYRRVLHCIARNHYLLTLVIVDKRPLHSLNSLHGLFHIPWQRQIFTLDHHVPNLPFAKPAIPIPPIISITPASLPRVKATKQVAKRHIRKLLTRQLINTLALTRKQIARPLPKTTQQLSKYAPFGRKFYKFSSKLHIRKTTSLTQINLIKNYLRIRMPFCFAQLDSVIIELHYVSLSIVVYSQVAFGSNHNADAIISALIVEANCVSIVVSKAYSKHLAIRSLKVSVLTATTIMLGTNNRSKLIKKILKKILSRAGNVLICLCKILKILHYLCTIFSDRNDGVMMFLAGNGGGFLSLISFSHLIKRLIGSTRSLQHPLSLGRIRHIVSPKRSPQHLIKPRRYRLINRIAHSLRAPGPMLRSLLSLCPRTRRRSRRHARLYHVHAPLRIPK